LTFIEELKRRNIVKAGAVYAVAGWAIMQVVDIAVAALGLPNWSVSFVLFVFVLGFPVVLLLAWAFEIRNGEVQLVDDVDKKTGRHTKAQMGGYVIASIIIIGIGFVTFPIFFSDIMGESVDTVGDAAEVATENSIAVLPFEDFSPNHDQAYFANGIAEEILNVLARIPGLKVASRSSSFRIQRDMAVADIARQLNVATLLEGSVRKSGGRVRITAQLINASDGFHLWSETFERELTDIFAIQDEISARIGELLLRRIQGNVDADGDEFLSADITEDVPPDAWSPELVAASVPGERLGGTLNMDAYHLFLRASYLRQQGTQIAVMQSIQLFEQALTLDEEFADAHAGLARSLVVSAGFMNGDIREKSEWSEARLALGRAFAINVENPGAILLYAFMQEREWKFRQAERNFIRGLARNDNDWEGHVWYSQFLNHFGRWEAAAAHLLEAERLNPFHGFACDYAYAMVNLGRDDVVEAYIDSTDAVRLQDCLLEFQFSLAVSDADAPRFAELRQAMGEDRWQAKFYIATFEDDFVGAEIALEQLDTMYQNGGFPAATLAEMYARHGNMDRAKELIAIADDEKSTQLLFMAAALISPPLPSKYSISFDVDYRLLLSGAPNLLEAYRRTGVDLLTVGSDS
jgi:TolB-like protein